MHKRLLLAILLSLTGISAFHAIETGQVLQLSLPVLLIETVDGEEPTCDYVFAPEGAFGIGTTNNTKVPGRAVIIAKGDTLFDSGIYQKDHSGMTIRIRGNTSAYYSAKKPFKIKLEKKGDMLSRGDSACYDKNWVLLRDGNDVLDTMIGNRLNQLVGMPYTPAYKYVNVVINNDYRGIYMLTETISRNRDCRLDVDKKSGYIIERDAYWWNEPVYFKTPMNMEYTFKYPDEDDVTDGQMAEIKSIIDKMEQSIDNGTYPQHINLRSFAAWLLAHDILGTADAGGSNLYLTKYDNSDTTLMAMSTLWDFGSIMRKDRKDQWSNIRTDHFFYYPRLLNNENTAFIAEYEELWRQLSPTVFDDMTSFLNDFRTSATATALQESRPYELSRWNYKGETVDENIDAAIEWFTSRRQWLEKAFNSTAIITQKQDPQPSSDVVYTLNGTKASQNSVRPGIYIRNGRKIIVR